jgi:hypothetical protein
MFEAALKEMEESGRPYWGPSSFQGYCMAQGLTAKKTADHISIDSQARLAPELKNAKCIVLRLGAPEGERNTHFGLSQCATGWDDYFLFDEEVFGTAVPEMFIPTVSYRHLFPFCLLPAFTETSLINLALASGLMAHALGLDEPSLPLATATGQSTHTFYFRPRIEARPPWLHSRGQVEIDSLFSARRGGQETVFLVESKASATIDSLAKHKLVYPLLAIRNQVPRYMDIVPVYLRAVESADGLHFYVAECRFADPEDGGAPVLADLRTVSAKHFVLRLPTR